MPPKKRPAATASDYDSDNGFVEDAAPKSKRSKVSVSKDRGGGGGGTKGNEKDKRIDKHVDKDGEEFWELSEKRRVGVQEYAGKRLINIREFYEKNGEMLPGKKGISLSVDQFNNLVKCLPQIEKALSVKGEKIDRPSYEGAGGSAADDGEGEEEMVVEKQATAKRNFEETSEEE